MFVFLTLFLTVGIIAGESLQAQARVIQETSRSLQEMNSVYPYDIDLIDKNGIKKKSSDLLSKNSKMTVILFWVTTCGPCRMELNAISKKYNQWKKEIDFDFFAISTDFSDRVDQFKFRVTESNWPFPAYLDINREFRMVMEGGLNGLPQLFVLNPKGEILYHTRKYRPGDEDSLFNFLKSI
jgi:cytochrome c biogenesis protein CcmG, thiol:disulfide interchange protein DsbE